VVVKPIPVPAKAVPAAVKAAPAAVPGKAAPAKFNRDVLRVLRTPEKRAEATAQVRQTIQGEAQQAVQQAVAGGADSGAVAALLEQYRGLLEETLALFGALLDGEYLDGGEWEEIPEIGEGPQEIMDAATVAKVKASTWTNFGKGWLFRPAGSRWFFASFKGPDGKRFDLPEPLLVASQFPEIAAALVVATKERPDETGIKAEREKMGKYATLSRLTDEKEKSKAALVFFWESVAPFAGIVMPVFLPATIAAVYNGIVGGDYAAAPGKGLEAAKEGAKAAVAAAVDVGKEAVIGAAKSGTLLPVLLVVGLVGGGFLYLKTH
jgi:hypothetical protein